MKIPGKEKATDIRKENIVVFRQSFPSLLEHGQGLVYPARILIDVRQVYISDINVLPFFNNSPEDPDSGTRIAFLAPEKDEEAS